MNWKNLVERQNAKTYVLPEGWDSRDTVATQLDCAPEKVHEHLKPCLAAHTVEKRDFVVWDTQLGQKVRITAYRQLKEGEPAARTSNHDGGAPWTKDEEAKMHAMKKAGASWNQIGKALGRTGNSVRKQFSRTK